MPPGLTTSLRRKAGMLRQALRKPLAPLILTANGRSGTTYLMGLLARHPQISIYNHYPYERTQAAYFVSMYRVLTERPDDDAEHREFRRNVAEHPQRLTRNPFLSSRNEAAIWYNKVYQDRVKTFTRRLCSDYYWHIALTANKKHPTLFAEYILPGMKISETFYELWPSTREIMLVRDMRDMFCSIRAFNEKRGFQSFGREYYDSDKQYIESVLGVAAEEMTARYSARREGLLLIRYEDLITDTDAALKSIMHYLSLETSTAIISDMQNTDTIDASHMTSSDAALSIGKWKSELAPDLLALCNNVFKNYHDTFDYTSD